jgi:UDP-N-acetylglucosamine acyltransferase
MTAIHPSAVVDPGAELAPDVTVGPFAYVGADVTLGAGCVVHPHVTLTGPLTAGERNVFHSQCVLGAAPQDLKYKGGRTAVIIGDDNSFREMVTIHRGTEVDEQSGGVTRIGNKNLFMVGVHLAHDCVIGNHVILANYVQVAGHVHIEDCVNIGGHSAMHHFVTIGKYAYIGGMTRMTSDVPPFVKASGYDADIRGLNTKGLERWKVTAASIDALKRAYRLLFGRRAERGIGNMAAALDEIEGNGLSADPQVAYLVAFLRRQMNTGVFGRSREAGRTDTDADRARFYAAAQPEKSA